MSNKWLEDICQHSSAQTHFQAHSLRFFPGEAMDADNQLDSSSNAGKSTEMMMVVEEEHFLLISLPEKRTISNLHNEIHNSSL